MIPSWTFTEDEKDVLIEIINRTKPNMEFAANKETLSWYKKDFVFKCIQAQEQSLNEDGVKNVQEAINKINANLA